MLEGLNSGFSQQAKQPEKKQNWFQKLAQFYKDDVARRESRSANKATMRKIRASEGPLGEQARNEAYPWLAKRPESVAKAKTKTKPKTAAKKDAISGWMQRKVDRRVARARAIYGDAVTDKEGKLTSKKLLKKDHLEEMDDLVGTLGKSQIPYATEGLETPYTPEELAIVQNKNIAFKMQHDKALKRYNELAEKYNLPKYGEKPKKENGKKGNGKNGDKPVDYDFSDPKIEITPEVIANVKLNPNPMQTTQLDSVINARINPAQNVLQAGESTSWIKDLLSNAVGDQWKDTRKRQEFVKTNPLWKKFTREERNKFRKDGIVPERFKDQINKAK